MQLKNNNNTKKQYDKWWSDFKSLNEGDPGTIFRANLIIIKINKLKIRNLVDVGCGAGELIQTIIQKSKNKLKITGFDISSIIIKNNKKKFNNIDFSTMNLDKIQKPKKKFDLVICSEVIEHVNNWKVGIINLSNLTNKNGYLIITTQNGKIYKHHKILGHLKHFQKKELEKELIKNNFRIIESYYLGWPFMNLKNILVNIFYTNLISASSMENKSKKFNKFSFNVFKVLYDISSKKNGPQIFIFAQKMD